MIRNARARLAASAFILSGLAACGNADKPATTTTETATVTTAPAIEAVPVPAAVTPPAAVPAMVSFASLTGDAGNGEKIFNQCKTCHVAEKGVNRIGPSLWGIVGRSAGIIPGFKYSPANKNSGIVWTDEKLYQYLEAPQKTVPGTYMAFAGLKQPQDRADVIAYLKTRA